ncbi:BTB/POZ domain-containing protein NPY5-like [Punica granatum]|uniref:BTB/POZ domain-containing protein NPY5-like n=2 Tax=Punica granatum TaxID=22663 RepID=A0A6P8CYE7_PUNGR|nr:BTB/POZ domain-containing protein NPY5-like [Punica granatum]XP_031386458.1 BTB/POZ domain-containing protein NPY5-like [Punica granatum]XP_031386459.1 BTB/POZ domain-containing protein NPY5-like [Punica granatum]XP_031386461.1 BTB/POZ domain-containing protein NPY5-like [Punica granatum]OWM65677.1 hypothetical protein CDL15_Pgr017174 [Punica granatum]PKI71300.1 hypothetical protein CRG98_008300 [Punica granatum]
MKFMKLGSKPDSFQAEGDNIRYVATELATDLAINVGDVKFYLHKFPLLSKSARLQKLVNEESADEIQIGDIPGGPAAFEVCAKFCYGMTVTLNAYNVVAARCASEYLEMYETVEKGNLIYKIEVFLNSSIFRSWKDSIIVLQTTRSLHPWSDELKVVSRCLDSIALKASIDTSKVEWSYTYNRKKLPSENGSGDEAHWNGVRKQQMVPKDWWVEDLCELQMDLYKRVITTIKAKGSVPSKVIGEALQAYALRRLPGFSKGVIQSNDIAKHRALVEMIMRLLPLEKGSVPCGFMLRLLRAAVLLECAEMERNNLMGRISLQLDEASVGDLLFRAPPGEPTMYDVETVERLVEEFAMHQRSDEISRVDEFGEEIKSPLRLSESKARVVKLVDGYLAEISRDPNLPLAKFVNLANMVSGFPRPTHDGLYRAIDMYLKEHSEITKSERKKICKLMDCSKLSAEACMHAVQNERLPLRVVVQVLFFEQARASTSSAGGTTPPLPGPIGSLLPGGSHGSSRSAATTNTEDDWDGVPTQEEIRALKGQLATLRLGGPSERNGPDGQGRGDRAAANKVKGLLASKIFSRLWSSKDRQGGELSSSDTSESPGSANAGETKSTPSRSRRHSVS